MKKVFVFTTTLGLGGITSYTVNLVNELSKHYEVTLAYTKDDYSKILEISPMVKMIIFKIPPLKETLIRVVKHGWLHHAIKMLFRNHNQISPMKSLQRIAYAKAEATDLSEVISEHYDFAISTAELYCNNVVALKVNSDVKIGWIHPDYNALQVDVAFDRKTLDQFDWIAVVSEENRNALYSIIPDYRDKVIYIPNLLNKKLLNEKSFVKPDEYKNAVNKHIIVTVCRLDNSSKRLDRAVKACKLLKEKDNEFLWFIIGDGPDHKMLKEEILRNNVEEQMIMLGSKTNPYPYVRYADLFVLTSQYEGRPISVDESLILNCPVIVSNYGSAQEQVKSEYGTVIENKDEKFAETFCDVLDWNIIKTQRQYLQEHDVLEDIQDEFDKKINIILNS